MDSNGQLCEACTILVLILSAAVAWWVFRKVGYAVGYFLGGL